MTEREKELYLNFYADGFDVYTADGRMPDSVMADDILGEFVRGVVDRNLRLGGDNPDFRESVKERTRGFVGDMLDEFSKYDTTQERERMVMETFLRGSASEKRAMWDEVKSITRAKYSKLDINTDGYDEQLDESNEEVLFQAFARDWKEARERRERMVKQRMLSSAAERWEKTCNSNFRSDTNARTRIRKEIAKYPYLEEIARIIGREKESPTRRMSKMKSKYLPSSLSVTCSYEEVDRVVAGNNLERVIPVEYSFLSEGATEMLFLKKYSLRQLQQFAAPGIHRAVKQKAETPEPRPDCGPMIVSVDTSGSMNGKAMEVAFAMTHYLLEVARRTGRRCYLITFSVRSKAIDLTAPGQWKKVDEFLANSYSGGTNGESMLREAVGRLRTERFSMADVLIISDFAFARPYPETLDLINAEKSKDTRFYGLQIGRIINQYQNILNKIWVVNP